MGKTHLSGLEISADPDHLQNAAVPQVMKLHFTALGAGQSFFLPDGAFITQVRVLSAAGALVVGTISIGAVLHGTGIFTGASTAGAALAVEKPAAAGNVYVEFTAGTLPLDAYISYIPG